MIMKFFKTKNQTAKNNKYQKTNSGFASLLAVIILGAVGTSIVTSIIFFGLGASLNSFSIEQSYQAKSLANACMEESMQQIRDNNSFVGSGGLVIGEWNCNYLVIDNGGEDRIINSYATIGNVVRKTKIEINQINPSINIVSWKDVAIF